jgi:hypothetical protein
LQADFPKLTGPYLGQKAPGMIPEIFAPGIISTEANEGSSCFSTDGQLYLFVRQRSPLCGILMMHQVNGKWSGPQLAPFSAGKYDWDFMLAPDNKRVYIASGRPIHEGGKPQKNFRIWISEQTHKGWSTPMLLPKPVNSGYHDSYPSLTEDNTLYFFSKREGGFGEGDIYKSEMINGQYKNVEILDSPINTKYSEVDPFIAPDESYLITCSNKPGGLGGFDIYISFPNEDGYWTEPVNMGDKINSTSDEYIPYVTPDNKYFFFTSAKTGNREIYWVDVKIMENYKDE